MHWRKLSWPCRICVALGKRVYQAATATVLAIYSLIAGLILLADSLIPDALYDAHLVTDSQSELAPWVTAIGLMLAIGAITSLTGILWLGDLISIAWHLEKIGWTLVVAATAAYAVVVGYTDADAVLAWMAPLAIAVAGLARVSVITAINYRSKKVLERQQATVEVREILSTHTEGDH